jgi:hypothetical protein
MMAEVLSKSHLGRNNGYTYGHCTPHHGFVTAGSTSYISLAATNCTFVGKKAKQWRQWPHADPAWMIAGCARGLTHRFENYTFAYLDSVMDLVGKGSASIWIYDDLPGHSQRELLKRWAARSHLEPTLILADPEPNSTTSTPWLLAHDKVAQGKESRLSRLALCRDVLLVEALKHLPTSGYLVSLDWDCDLPQARTLYQWMKAAHNLQSQFGALVSSNYGGHRDMWALRSQRLFMDYDCFWDAKTMITRGNCWKHTIWVHHEAPVFEIEGGFNGAVIYAARSIRQRKATDCRHATSSYAAQHNSSTGGKPVCEHVPLQQCLRNHGFRIALTPWMTTACNGGSFLHSTASHAVAKVMLPNGTVLVTNRLRTKSLLKTYKFRMPIPRSLHGDNKPILPYEPSTR